jgi:uncharacterized protein (TIGR03435 family)
MTDANDMQLLQEYAQRNSESAFAELVERHLALVYSAALRHVGIPAHAEEITQAVFVILARKAAGLRANTVLAAWLYETTRLTALNFLRGERRRHFREQEACMQSTLDNSSGPSSQEFWNQLSPLLDEAMARLGKKDRHAVILRFFKDKSLQEVAATMQVSEAAAQRRVLRALEKLRKIFAQRGVLSTGAIIAGTISHHSVQAAPAALAKTVNAVAIANGSIAAGSTLTLVKGTMKLMTMLKLKTAGAIGAAIIIATGTTVVATKVIAQSSANTAPPSADAPAIDDSVWARMDSRVLDTAPPVFILRPTHFTNSWTGTAASDNKMMGRSLSFEALISMAYRVNPPRMVPMSDKVAGHFDLLMTSADACQEKLQKEIARQLGYTAHREVQPTDVLVLTLKQAGAPGLKPHEAQNGGGNFMASGRSPAHGSAHTRGFNSQNQPVPGLIKNLENLFEKPVVDRTGLTGNFDVSLNIETPDSGPDYDALIQGVQAQLGLDLTPAHEPLEMLVIEKVKK